MGSARTVLADTPGGLCACGRWRFVCIELPNFRSKDTRSNFYLPPKAAEALKACIRNRFDIEMWNALHRFDAIFQRQDNLIYAFMEKHGIEQTEKNWNAIAKRYQRKRDIYKRIARRKKVHKNNTDLDPPKTDLSVLSSLLLR